MIEAILGSVAVISLTTLMAVIKVHKNQCNMCHYNCENCGEKDVCGIKREDKHEER